jgi:hypothetical protein
VNQSESAADDPAVLEEGIDLMGVGISGDIKIFRGLPQEEIPDTSSNEISQKSMMVKAIEDLQSLFIDPLS